MSGKFTMKRNSSFAIYPSLRHPDPPSVRTLAVHSYRHGFHAANHADVLKHAILVQMLDYATRKPAALQVIDTHAGAGLYDLGHDWSRQSGEAEAGVRRLLQEDGAADAEPVDGIAVNVEPADVDAGKPQRGSDADPPPLMTRYLQALAQCRARHGAQSYPGSPWLALQALRRGDHLHVFETHPGEIQTLRRLPDLCADMSARRVTVHHADGFSAPKALLPPPSRRGIVVMDPSYEDKQDYRRVTQALKQGLQRFVTGSYLVWHPLVQRREVQEMLRSLRRLPGVDWLHATLQVKQAPRDGVGLYGSGVFVVNPPWTLREELQAALPWLCERLAQDGHARTELHAC